MKYCKYIYGRTLKIDFREICAPPEGISEDSKSLVKQLLNTDVVSNGNINCIRYLFIREEKQIIFGIGINHFKYLDEKYHTDESRKRGLRSFIGITVSVEEFESITSIPIDHNFFINLYYKEIEKVWNLEDRTKNKSVIISEQYESVPEENWISLNGDIRFNNDKSKCHLYNISEEESILKSLKNCQSCVAIGLNNKGHIITSARRFKVFFLNAICTDILVENDVRFKNKKEDLAINKEDEYSCQPSQLIKPSTEGKLIKEKGKNNKSYENITESESSHFPTVLEMFPQKKEEIKPNVKRKLHTEDNLMNINWGDSIKDSLNTDESEVIKPSNIKDQTNDLFSDKRSISGNSENEFVEDSDKTEKPKKANRLKLIVGGVIALTVILLILGKCIKTTQTNSRQSISGDTIQAQSQKQK